MQSAIYTTPNTVYVEANQPVFQQYTSGVITSSSCGTNTDHAILAVGYHTSTSGDNYWIVENSWGTGWGQAGYVYIGMAPGSGVCGINTGVYYPFVRTPTQ